MTDQPLNLVPIPIGELHFDPKNPRLPPDVDGSDDQDVLAWMLQDAGLLELMGSIAVKGFFPAEPLLVTPIADASGYWVLEGNRRLAAVLLLLDPSRAPSRKNAVRQVVEQSQNTDNLATLPCAVFQMREEVLDYLGYRHITGIKQWEPAAKARYLESLYKLHFPSEGDQVYRTIARIIGSRSDYVMRLLGSLSLYEAIAGMGELAVREGDVFIFAPHIGSQLREYSRVSGDTVINAGGFRRGEPSQPSRARDLAIRTERRTWSNSAWR